MKDQSTFVHSKWYLVLFVMGFSLICGLLIYDLLVGTEAFSPIIILPFWIMITSQMHHPNRSRYQVWAFRYASFSVGLTWAIEVFATQANPAAYLICLPLLVFAVLPTRFLDRYFRSGK